MQFLHSLAEWLKPILVITLISLIGVGIKIFLKHVYAQILVDLESARLKVWAESGSAKPPGMVIIPEAKIFKRVRWPVWLITRAKNYQARREKLKLL